MRGPFQPLKLEENKADMSLLVSRSHGMVRTQAAKDAQYRWDDDAVISSPEHPSPPGDNRVLRSTVGTISVELT